MSILKNKNNVELLIEGLASKDRLEFFVDKLSYLYVNSNKERETIEDLKSVISESHLEEMGYQPSEAEIICRVFMELTKKLVHEECYIDRDSFWLIGGERNKAHERDEAIVLDGCDIDRERRGFQSIMQWKSEFFIKNAIRRKIFAKLEFFVDCKNNRSDPTIFSEVNLIKRGLIDQDKCFTSKKMGEFLGVCKEYRNYISDEECVMFLIWFSENKCGVMLNHMAEFYGNIGRNGNLLICTAVYQSSIEMINSLLPKLDSFVIEYDQSTRIPNGVLYRKMDKHKDCILAADLAQLVGLDMEIEKNIRNAQERLELLGSIAVDKSKKNYGKSL